ncbi:MarR family winged helix-turn-helix transcriptional regulator [Bradyrhizobium sp.]|uniref:MarR family winged helix-turn-helix transcriptional regulator n=1 Tax=Bradyrhizobium sp. TaxID=376 RepID=UPI003C5FCDC3
MRAPVVENNRCNCAALRKASRRLSQLYDAALASSGLKATQFAILAEIERRQEAAPTMRDLADALVMDQSTIGQNLRPLERDGLIALVLDKADRRRRHVTLTKHGRSRFAAARPLWETAQTRFESHFGKQEAANLRAALSTIAEAPMDPGPSWFSPRHESPR